MQEIGLFLLKALLEFKSLQDALKLRFALVLVSGWFSQQKPTTKINVFYKYVLEDKEKTVQFWD